MQPSIDPAVAPSHGCGWLHRSSYLYYQTYPQFNIVYGTRLAVCLSFGVALSGSTVQSAAASMLQSRSLLARRCAVWCMLKLQPACISAHVRHVSGQPAEPELLMQVRGLRGTHMISNSGSNSTTFANLSIKTANEFAVATGAGSGNIFLNNVIAPRSTPFPGTGEVLL